MRKIVAGTGVAVAILLPLSLRIAPGDPLFHAGNLALIIVYLLGALGAKARGLQLPLGARHLPLGLAAGGLMTGAFLLGALAVARIPALANPVSLLLTHAEGNLPLVLIWLIAGGIGEELYFRGALWEALPAHRLAITTIIYTAIIALAGIWLLTFAAAAMGLVAGYVRSRSGSLLPAIIAHLMWSSTMLLALPTLVS
ncbi:MAG: CPBP family intramembrane metalloprotease [Flaviflexus sp.]|nr:CPBP family intramembrane metalloprotease [Flaviflexus sp.]